MKVGQIVRLSEVGIAQQWWPSLRVRHPEKLLGRVVHVARTGTISVRWCGWETPQKYQGDRTEGLEIAPSAILVGLTIPERGGAR